jgi:GH35 family endo-1,4-beta-xylanase
VDDADWKAKKQYHPYLFDAQGRAKPAFFAVREALEKSLPRTK